MDHLLTEARNPSSMNLDQLTSIEIVHLMNDEDAKIIPAIRKEAEKIAQAITLIGDRMRKGGRLIYCGAGTSGRLGVLDASECPPTFSTPPGLVIGLIAGGYTALTSAVEGAEDRLELAIQDLKAIHLSQRDVVVGIATSGRTPYVCRALEYARLIGATPIGLSCVEQSDLGPLSDIHINPLVGPEVLTGSTRLKAGTATKLILNMLTTGAMIRLGKTYGNLMVDLRASNSKLKARTNRIVRHFTGLSVEQADELLTQCDGELKTALVVYLTKLSPEDSRQRLSQIGGQVGKVIETVTKPTLLDVPIPKSLYLGIDGGGSHTKVLLATHNSNTWKILGKGESGPSNFQTVGKEKATRNLYQGIHEAFQSAHLPLTPVDGAGFGLAGAGRSEDQQFIHQWAKEHKIAEKIAVVGDVELLLSAKGLSGTGIAIVSGTGSIVWGRNPAGKSARSGGWGPILGDEGSAYALVMDAIKSCIRSVDRRGPSTTLTQRLLDAMKLKQPTDWIGAIQGGTWDRTALANLAPLVIETAQKGDSVSQQLIDAMQGVLLENVAAVKEELGFSGKAIPVVLSGGLFLHHSWYRERFIQRLGAFIQASPLELVSEPAEGALNLAKSVM